MKKYFLSLGLLTAAVGCSTAQAQRNVSLGLKAGGSLSNFAGSDNFNNTFGFHAGMFANIGFTRLFAFQPELLYSQKGAEISSADTRFRLNYVDVPLVFHVNADGLFFEAGPQLGLLVAANSKVGSVSIDAKPGYNSVDFGYLFGLGYQRKTGPGIGLRYNGGFTNVGKAVKIGNTTVQQDRRNSVFQLYLTYSLQGR